MYFVASGVFRVTDALVVNPKFRRRCQLSRASSITTAHVLKHSAVLC